MQWKECTSNSPSGIGKQYEFKRVLSSTGITLHAVVVYLPAAPFRGKEGWYYGFVKDDTRWTKEPVGPHDQASTAMALCQGVFIHDLLDACSGPILIGGD